MVQLSATSVQANHVEKWEYFLLHMIGIIDMIAPSLLVQLKGERKTHAHRLDWTHMHRIINMQWSYIEMVRMRFYFQSLLAHFSQPSSPSWPNASLSHITQAGSSYLIMLRVRLYTESTLQTHSTLLPQLEGCYRQSCVSMTLKAAGSNVEVGVFWLKSVISIMVTSLGLDPI